jgi:hypothetical protein
MIGWGLIERHSAPAELVAVVGCCSFVCLLVRVRHALPYQLMEGVAQCRIDGGNTHYIC